MAGVPCSLKTTGITLPSPSRGENLGNKGYYTSDTIPGESYMEDKGKYEGTGIINASLKSPWRRARQPRQTPCSA